MEMDPNQLYMMQDLAPELIHAVPGMLSAGSRGGAQRLSALSDPSNPTYASPMAGTPVPDLSPMAPLGLQNFGIGGQLAGMAGNLYLAQTMTQSGSLPTGNSGSYMQAYRNRNLQNQQAQLASKVASQDAESYYRTLRGAAAMVGLPFNQAQQQAARGFAQTIANAGPTLAAVAPELMDAMTGERGSVQAMASQMMDANRYKLDPVSGKMGYAVSANADLVNNVFQNMFTEDSTAQRQGIRAGDIGQLYKGLAAEGLAGPRGSMRDRTIQALQEARQEGVDLQKVGAAQGIGVGANMNLESLSNMDLTSLRQDKGVQARLSKSDAKQVSDQLSGYVSSLSAMREVFGENGDPNAPVPKLINALKGLTSGQMQRFDPAQLNTMVRDMQALSQVSGKSVDQLLAMTETANALNTRMLRGNGVSFNPTSTNVGVTTGMAFAQEGGATGFGALNREQAEQSAMGLFSRGLASEMGNAMGTLTRIEKAGGFADNQAGRQMKAAMDAADAGAKTYAFKADDGQTITRNVPTREMEFMSMARNGAVSGMDASGFSMMLGDRTSNLRALSTNPERQQAAMRQQGFEIDREIARVAGNRLGSDQALMSGIADPRLRAEAGMAMGQAATNALTSLDMTQLQSDPARNRAIADALKVEASNQGVVLDDKAALTMAAGVFGQAETTVRRFGFDAFTAKQQVLGQGVSESRDSQQAVASARAGLNQAMSGLGPKGSPLARVLSALQKQGDRGADANISTMLGDIFAGSADMDATTLSGPIKEVQARKVAVEELTGRLNGATPEQRQQLQAQIKDQVGMLDKAVQATLKAAEPMGLVGQEGTFNKEDLIRGQQATREMGHINRMSQVQTLALSSTVTDVDRQAASATTLNQRDLQAVASRLAQLKGDQIDATSFDKLLKENEDAQEHYDQLVKEVGVVPAEAEKIVRQNLRNEMDTPDAEDLKELYGDQMTLGKLDTATQDAVIRARRTALAKLPDDQAVLARRDLMRGNAKLTVDQDRNLLKQAEDQLIAENQLKAVGQLKDNQTLMAGKTELDGYTLDSALKTELAAADPKDRAQVVNKYLDSQLSYSDNARKTAVAYSHTAEGRQAAADVEQNVGAISDLRREFMQDTGAFARGGLRGQLAVKQSQAAEDTLQTLANDYFEGDRGRMINSAGLAMSDRGRTKATAQLAAMPAEEKAAIAARLGIEVKALDVNQFQRFIGLQAKDAVGTMAGAMDAFTGAADKTYADLIKPTEATTALATQLLGTEATKEQAAGMQALSSAAALKGTDVAGITKGLDLANITKQIAAGEQIDTQGMSAEQKSLVEMASGMKSLSKLDEEKLKALASVAEIGTVDAKAKAKELGMTEAEYMKIRQGGKADRNVVMDKPAVDAALADEAQLQTLTRRLNRTGMSEEARSNFTRQSDEIKTRRNERMVEAGLKPGDAEDELKYKAQLTHQGDIKKLMTEGERYKKDSEQLSVSMGTADFESAKSALVSVNKQAKEDAAKLAARDLGSESLNTLADAFGQEDPEKRTAFRQMVGSRGTNTERNNLLVSNVLKDLKLTSDKDGTAINKLDTLVDKYKAATDTEKTDIAKTMGISPEALAKGMRSTEFLEMDKIAGKYTEANYESALKRKAGVDVAKEVEQSEPRSMRIDGGVIEIKGDITGTGTPHNVIVTGGQR
jgi:hypothetical protein